MPYVNISVENALFDVSTKDLVEELIRRGDYPFTDMPDDMKDAASELLNDLEAIFGAGTFKKNDVLHFRLVLQHLRGLIGDEPEHKPKLTP